MLMNWYTFIEFLMFLSGAWIYCSKRKHLLIMLLSLEYLVLALFIFLNMFKKNKMWLFMLMVYLVFAVCEGVLGLGLLILMIRSFGNDYLVSSDFTMLKYIFMMLFLIPVCFF